MDVHQTEWRTWRGRAGSNQPTRRCPAAAVHNGNVALTLKAGCSLRRCRVNTNRRAGRAYTARTNGRLAKHTGSSSWRPKPVWAIGAMCLKHCLNLFATGDTSLSACAARIQEMNAVSEALGVLAAADSAQLKAFVPVCIAVHDACEQDMAQAYPPSALHGDRRGMCQSHWRNVQKVWYTFTGDRRLDPP